MKPYVEAFTEKYSILIQDNSSVVFILQQMELLCNLEFTL